MDSGSGSKYLKKISFFLGGSLGLVVMGDDSWSRGRGFESRHHILDGDFSHLFVVKTVLFVWKRTENKRKRGRVWAISFYKKMCFFFTFIHFSLSLFFRRFVCEWSQFRKFRRKMWKCKHTKRARSTAANVVQTFSLERTNVQAKIKLLMTSRVRSHVRQDMSNCATIRNRVISLRFCGDDDATSKTNHFFENIFFAKIETELRVNVEFNPMKIFLA